MELPESSNWPSYDLDEIRKCSVRLGRRFAWGCSHVIGDFVFGRKSQSPEPCLSSRCASSAVSFSGSGTPKIPVSSRTESGLEPMTGSEGADFSSPGTESFWLVLLRVARAVATLAMGFRDLSGVSFKFEFARNSLLLESLGWPFCLVFFFCSAEGATVDTLLLSSASNGVSSSITASSAETGWPSDATSKIISSVVSEGVSPLISSVADLRFGFHMTQSGLADLQSVRSIL